MKKLVPCLAVAALVLAGCGKTAEQKAMESDLNAQVQKLHDAGMSKMRQLADLSTQIDKTMSQHDSLAKAFPKQFASHSTADLTAAQDALGGAKSGMDAWMKGYKRFDPEAKHEENVTLLTKDVTELTKLNGTIDTAIADATKALESHAAFAADLLAKVTVKKKVK